MRKYGSWHGRCSTTYENMMQELIAKFSGWSNTALEIVAKSPLVKVAFKVKENKKQKQK